ncbi:chromate transporter [Acinetobacter sp. ANC 5054]|uniref:chromate efflux transporter n=1 Tax=Acinetobacter sp. ANC 5054 TaxID=1977877 RepID=UPI000A354FB4|nr:chromate efflux transporter [Acinetobacter sp. ANC 5054]OTG83521.1 chromate transporter [Acinetobacter sp. ANC 5054]
MDKKFALPISYQHLWMSFFKLGCIAFGGPAAHLVLFYRYFVQQQKWLSENEYSHLLTLAQLLPGPTSSQVGMAIGYSLKGYQGAIVAWFGFTLPSAVVMTVIALIGLQYAELFSNQFFHMIQLIVIAVVAWAFWQMMRSFCQTKSQYLLMLCAGFFVYFTTTAFNQILVILFAALIGLFLYRKNCFQTRQASVPTAANPIDLKHQNLYFRTLKWSWLWLVAFISPFLIFHLCEITRHATSCYSLESFYRTASLVFGGGHIILPFLHQDFVQNGMISNETFDLGYAVAQLMPGPLFSFASYLGPFLPISSSNVINAILATVAVFLPSFFLLFGLLPYWSKLMNYSIIFNVIKAVNAAVVGLLLCLLIQMGQKYILQAVDVLFIVFVIVLLRSKIPVWVSLMVSFAVYFGLLNILNTL